MICFVIATAYFYTFRSPNRGVLTQAPPNRLSAISEAWACNAVPLARFFDEFAARAGIHVRVDWDALRDEGLAPETPVTFEAREVRAFRYRQILQFALNDMKLSLAPERPRPCFVSEIEDDGTVLISTARGLARNALVCRYDARALIFTADRFDGVHIPPLEGQTKRQQDDDVGPSAEELAAAVMKLITDTVDTDSWIGNGGAVGTIRFDEGWLTVRQAASAHRSIERLMQQLAETRSQPFIYDIERRMRGTR
jgi:hypothetical protein